MKYPNINCEKTSMTDRQKVDKMIDNNGPCLCGSGKTWGTCCKLRIIQLEKSGKEIELLSSEEFFKPKYKQYINDLVSNMCVAKMNSNVTTPCDSSSGNNVQRCHTIYRSKILEKYSLSIEINKFASEFIVNKENQLRSEKDFNDYNLVKISNKKASITNVFCNNHDQLFKPIEPSDTASLYDQTLLHDSCYILRAACVDYYGSYLQIKSKEEYVKKDPRIIYFSRMDRIEGPSCFLIDYEAAIESFKNATKNINDAISLCFELNNTGRSSSGIVVNTHSRVIDNVTANMAACEPFTPELTGLPLEEKTDELIYFNMFPISNDKIQVIISTLGNNYYKQLFSLLDKLSDSEYLDFLSINISKRVQNIFFSEDKIKTCDKASIDEYLKSFYDYNYDMDKDLVKNFLFGK